MLVFVAGRVEVTKLLLEAGADKEAKDMNGDSPLTWASWHLRPYGFTRLFHGIIRLGVWISGPPRRTQLSAAAAAAADSSTSAARGARAAPRPAIPSI